MAFIKRVSVEQLATHRIDREIDFNRDVNVFFGVNGSGKTSLLRIIQGALSGRSGDIRSLPFASASVEIGDAYVFNPEGEDYFGDLTRQTLTEAPPPCQLSLSSEIEHLQKTERGGRKIWHTFEAGVFDQSFQVRHVYLPISRLYVSDDRRLPRALRDSSRGSLMSEAALEKLFAEVVNFLWLRYTRNTSLEIQDTQSTGLSEILGDFLAPDPDADEPYDTNVQEAYQRLQTFLARQESHPTITQEAFADRIRVDKRMRRVLKYIEAVETRVEQIRRPRNEFDRVLQRMISSEKNVKLGDKDIHAYADTEEIELGNLSSGEKQLIRICVEALLADGAPVLIDEPELSMHIDWQRELIPAIRALAPKSQLIIATHSPEIMAPLVSNQIFEL
jgi:predicted ATPase